MLYIHMCNYVLYMTCVTLYYIWHMHNYALYMIYVYTYIYCVLCRMWSVNTGHCLKIFRGHRDTVLTINVLGDLLISGSKDKSCKGDTAKFVVGLYWGVGCITSVCGHNQYWLSQIKQLGFNDSMLHTSYFLLHCMVQKYW